LRNPKFQKKQEKNKTRLFRISSKKERKLARARTAPENPRLHTHTEREIYRVSLHLSFFTKSNAHKKKKKKSFATFFSIQIQSEKKENNKIS